MDGHMDTSGRGQHIELAWALLCLVTELPLIFNLSHSRQGSAHSENILWLKNVHSISQNICLYFTPSSKIFISCHAFLKRFLYIIKEVWVLYIPPLIKAELCNRLLPWRQRKVSPHCVRHEVHEDMTKQPIWPHFQNGKNCQAVQEGRNPRKTVPFQIGPSQPWRHEAVWVS